MPTDRWHRLTRLFAEASAQPAGLREAFLDRACGADADLRGEVASLLTAAEQSPDFLSAPALELFARQICREGWSLQPGQRIDAYLVERRLGAGGMGEVWKAHDERLGRDVAIKLLLPHPSNVEGRVTAFHREARAAGALNHTNVLTVYDVGEYADAPYLVTECLEGESLRARLRGGALPVDEALQIALQAAHGLGAAHARGIVHRDLKPENIFLASDGRVKLLDFGLATLRDGPGPAGDTAAPGMGTAGYMAPEQIAGGIVDGRADIFALGTVLFEMLAGARPSRPDGTNGVRPGPGAGPRPVALAAAPGPAAVSRLVARCLAHEPDDRFATVADLETVLDTLVHSRSSSPVSLAVSRFLRRPAVVAAVLLVIAAAAIGGWRWRAAASRAEWARTVALPEARRLSAHGDHASAFVLVRQALDVLPDDPELQQLWVDVSVPARISTEPAGADVAFAPYRGGAASWFPLGRTPLAGVRIPRAMIQVRITMPGYQTIHGSGSPPAMLYRLTPAAATPPGMVRVVGGDLPDFWINRFEVTNREFKTFVDQGGYLRRDFWREPFVEAGRGLSWDEAVGRFRDATGRPGPAGWQSGTYPEGQAEVPVGGVSWYEASAYAVFAGKSLPTMHHWYRTAGLGRFADILTVSNFTGEGPAPGGRFEGLGPFGTYDMAGNMKEWCSTETAGDRRFLLGGAWNEPRYAYADHDAREAFQRAPAFGFRLARYDAPLPPSVAAAVRIENIVRDGRQLTPVSDAIFAVFQRQYAYNRAPLNAVIEATEEAEAWVRETIAFDAAYGDERMRAHLFRPKAAASPYQTVVFFPAADAFGLRSSRDMSLAWVDFIIRSGRAVLYPVYKGTYERAAGQQTGPNAQRELRIAWSRDLGRAIDYLETRPDIDRTRLAFYGVSAGADAGVILTALEPRLKASVLQGTGIWGDEAPESDAFNYAPRVRMPTLMVNGRYDFSVPLESAQRPLFALLGSRPEDKRHAVLDAGHALPSGDVAHVALPWLDRYLGPVVHPRSSR